MYSTYGATCPPSHPTALPTISFRVLYRVPPDGNTSRWRLATDTYPAAQPGGYGVTAGFIDGWRDDIKKAWTEGCVRKPVDCASHLLGSAALRIRTTGERPTSNDVGAFRNVCQFSPMNTDDPIVFPGRSNASHLHTFWGNTATRASSTAQSIATTGNSTCRGGAANRSAYRVPAVIDTATGRPIAPELIHVYYKSGYYGIRPDQITAFPAGLRMVAGSAKATAPQEHTYWGCFGGTGGQVPTIPNNCPVGDHVAMSLNFPQSSDAYDGPGGYSIHGDWFDGWQEEVKQTWIANCVRKAVSCGSHMLGDGRVLDGDR